MKRSETSKSSTSGDAPEESRTAGPRRSEPEDHLVFMGLEYGIADSQTRRRDQRGCRQEADSRPVPLVQNVVKQLDKVKRRVETQTPLRVLETLDRIEDR